MDLVDVERWFRQSHGRHPGDGEVKVGTLDNPGWRLKVLLPDNPPDRDILRCDPDDPGDAWVDVRVKGGILEGASGPRQLGALISYLLAYPGVPKGPGSIEEPIERLIEWYTSRCNKDWEHGGGVHLHSLGEGWRLTLMLDYWPEPEHTPPRGAVLRQDGNGVVLEGSLDSLSEFLLQLRPLPADAKPTC